MSCEVNTGPRALFRRINEFDRYFVYMRRAGAVDRVDADSLGDNV
jgi:hypothetical protein